MRERKGVPIPRSTPIFLLVLSLATPVTTRAQEPEPRTYSNAPVGMNFVVVAYNLQWGSLLFDPALPVEDASATINTLALAYVRALDVFGHGGKISVTLPIASGEFRGEYLGQAAEVTRRGIADPRVTVVVNLAGAPALDREAFTAYRQRTIVGASFQVAVPVGQYEPDRVINLGTNRWGFRPGVGVSHQAGPWIVEGSASVGLFTTNDELLETRRFTQRPIGLFEGSVIRYFTPRIWGAVHALWVTGGAGVLDGRENAAAQGNARLGASVSLPLARGQSMKIGIAESAVTRFGNDFASLSFVYQRAW